jgi:hypothetical protein
MIKCKITIFGGEIMSQIYKQEIQKRIFTIQPIGSIEADHGESYVSYYLVQVLDQESQPEYEPQKIDGLDVHFVISELFPNVHCQHSYDCCGQWYPNAGIFVGYVFGGFIVEQKVQLNI